MLLPLQEFFCDKTISYRSLIKNRHDSRIIIMIPGGPYLSSYYLDPFLTHLSNHLDVNVGIVDLPNHGDSVIPSSHLPITYQYCLSAINDFLFEISEYGHKIILFGQSFGARLVFDLISLFDSKVAGAFLTGFPYQFKLSERMQREIKNALMKIDLSLNEEMKFKKLWENILPLYTRFPIAKEVFSKLIDNIKVIGNDHLLDDVKPIELSLLQIKSKPTYLTITQGDSDFAVPDNNLAILKKLIPWASFNEIKECGHFPMIENEKETICLFSEFYQSL